MRTYEDIEYCRRGDDPQFLDLYLPDNQPRAMVVYAHGGGFRQGSRKNDTIPLLAQILTQRGVMVASAGYRLNTGMDAFGQSDRIYIRDNAERTLEYLPCLRKKPHLCGSEFEAACRDINEAVRFCRHAGAEFGLKDAPIGYIGMSAGGIAGLNLAHLQFSDPAVAAAYHQDGVPDAVLSVSAAMVQPWLLGPKGSPAILFNTRQDRILEFENAKATERHARESGADLILMESAKKGHIRQLDYLVKQVQPIGQHDRNLITEFLTLLH